MNLLGRVCVFPEIPERIGGVRELAHNMYWSWTPAAQELFVELDGDSWEAVYHNPVRLLSEVSQERLRQAAGDPSFLALYDRVMADFHAYMHPGETWFARTFPDLADRTIAYFSAEFGLHEALPIYSGGLGILSGDHCKSASDLGLPFVGVGLLYNQGYFRQRFSADGWQEALYDKLNFSQLPIQPATGPDGNEVIVSVDLPGRAVYAKVWRVQVGRVPVFLLDTDIERNSTDDRRFSAQLYGGDHNMRISQEIVLGIGGVRALRALGYRPATWHMNEGHSAFLGLERVRELVSKGLTFFEAAEAVAANAVFTTHTPVPAGNDAFGFDLMEKYFSRYWGSLGLNREEFLSLAKEDRAGGVSLFSMTVLALRLAKRANGVSKLHGAVSRNIWKDLWPGIPTEEVPITSITNGIHSETWLAPSMARFLDEHCPAWREEGEHAEAWAAVSHADDGAYWAVRQGLKREMVGFLRERIAHQRLSNGETATQVQAAQHVLDPEALTIGFARRFATYKRATLIFRDPERLKRLLNDPDRPVQILFAGKAHPADKPGKELIQQIFQLSQQPGFKGKILLVEDYDMNVARHLVQGVDVWLNNPRRPLEASGTSGQKAALNGALNFSVLDGWWCEGFNGRNGWSIGTDRDFRTLEDQDDADAASLYASLEEEIVPLFYDRRDGLPNGWIARSKEAIRSCAPVFGTRRMVQDYCRDLYVPAAQQGDRLAQEAFGPAKSLAHWKDMVRYHWHQIHVEAWGPQEIQVPLGHPVALVAKVRVGAMDPGSLSVEIVSGLEKDGDLREVGVVPMERGEQTPDGAWLYRGSFTPPEGGRFSYGIRAIPAHPLLVQRHELGLVRWATAGTEGTFPGTPALSLSRTAT